MAHCCISSQTSGKHCRGYVTGRLDGHFEVLIWVNAHFLQGGMCSSLQHPLVMSLKFYWSYLRKTQTGQLRLQYSEHRLYMKAGHSQWHHPFVSKNCIYFRPLWFVETSEEQIGLRSWRAKSPLLAICTSAAEVLQTRNLCTSFIYSLGFWIFRTWLTRQR